LERKGNLAFLEKISCKRKKEGDGQDSSRNYEEEIRSSSELSLVHQSTAEIKRE
jgi:hypothetical protein